MKKTLYTCLISVFAAIQSAKIQANTTCNDFGHFDLYINVDPPASDGACCAENASVYTPMRRLLQRFDGFSHL